MSENTENTQVEEREEPVVEPASETTETKPTLLNDVAAPANALVGDENIPQAGDVDVIDHNEDVPAQVMSKEPITVPETVKETVTVVRLDEVITDPSSPLAVQIPDAGRGSLDLPFHRLRSPRPEEVFSGNADPDYDHSDSVLDGDGEAVSTDGRVLPTP